MATAPTTHRDEDPTATDEAESKVESAEAPKAVVQRMAAPKEPNVVDDEGSGGPLGSADVLASFRAAFAGVGRTVASQRNMKLHVLSALMVSIVGMALPLDLSMRVALLFAVAMVFFAEILNTGLEALVDLFIGEFHRLAMLAKDAAAAGVLVLAAVAVLIFADIVWTSWNLVTENLDAVVRSIVIGGPLVLSEAAGLFIVRRGPIGWLRVLVSLGLLVPLVLSSTDPVFSFFAIGLVIMAFWARAAFPSTTGRGAASRNEAEPA